MMQTVILSDQKIFIKPQALKLTWKVFWQEFKNHYSSKPIPPDDFFRVPKRSSPDRICFNSMQGVYQCGSQLGKLQHLKTSLLPSSNLTSPHLFNSISPIPTWEKYILGVLLLQAIAQDGENWNSSPQQVSLKENATLPPLPVERKTDRQRSEPVTTSPQDYEWLKSWRISRVIPKDWPFKKQKKHQKRCNSSSAILPL